MRPMPCKGDAYRGELTGGKRSCYSCDQAAPEVRFGAPPPAGATGGKCLGHRGWEVVAAALMEEVGT